MHSVTFLVPVLVGLVGLDGDLAGDEEGFSCRQAIPALHWSVVGCNILCSERKLWSGKAFLDFIMYQIKMSMKVWAGSLACWGHLYQEREQGGQGELGQAGGGG